VKLLDVNILIYAYDLGSPHCKVCGQWLQSLFDDDDSIGLSWQTVVGFLRVATNPRAMRIPLSPRAATEIVSALLAQRQVRIVEPAGRYWQILSETMIREKVIGPLVPDAALAALAIEHGATLCSADRDFRRFAGLKLFDPTDNLHSR
jgi:toxin-antitoxin system PIN domain toxin